MIGIEVVKYYAGYLVDGPPADRHQRTRTDKDKNYPGSGNNQCDYPAQ